jgi:hypothetical protein
MWSSILKAIMSLILMFSDTSKNEESPEVVNSTVSFDPITRNRTGRETYFFAHGDWGKGGYYGNYTDHRRRLLGEETKTISGYNMHRRTAEGEGGEGHGEDRHGEEERGEGEHHEERKEDPLMQGRVADAMGFVANYTPPSFVLALGDNFYTEGVASTNDSRWSTHFRQVYFEQFDSLQGVPWHPALGNHDLGYGSTGVQAQINRSDYDSGDDDGAWQMPAQYYTVKYDIPGGGFVQVIVVDTTWLAPSENGATNEEGGISTSTQAARLYSELNALYDIFQATLEYPRPTWLLVAGHYPMYSQGEKGDNSELITYLLPFLQHYGVHAYLCGHDHINEHLQSNGIEYFVAGASTMNGYLHDDVSTAASVKWAGEDYSAFARFTATLDDLTVDYVNTNKTVTYSYTLVAGGQDVVDEFIEKVWKDLGGSPVAMAAMLTTALVLGMWYIKYDTKKLRSHAKVSVFGSDSVPRSLTEQSWRPDYAARGQHKNTLYRVTMSEKEKHRDRLEQGIGARVAPPLYTDDSDDYLSVLPPVAQDEDEDGYFRDGSSVQTTAGSGWPVSTDISLASEPGRERKGSAREAGLSGWAGDGGGLRYEREEDEEEEEVEEDDDVIGGYITVERRNTARF